MVFKSVREMASKWGLTERRVTALCREKRIPGAYKIENEWLIPEDAECPKDKRTRGYEEEKGQDDLLRSVAFFILSQEDSGVDGKGIEWKDSTLDRVEKKKYEAVRDRLPESWKVAADRWYEKRKNEVAEAVEAFKKKAKKIDQKMVEEIKADALEKGYDAEVVLKALGLKYSSF